MSQCDPVTEAVAHAGELMELPGLALQTARHGGQVKIEFARGQGWSGIDAERELARLHVPICGRGFTDKTLYLYVRRRQSRWAEYILRRAGCPVLTVIDERNEGWAAGKGHIPSWAETASRMRVGRGRSRQRAVIIRRPEPARGWFVRLVDWICGGGQ